MANHKCYRIKGRSGKRTYKRQNDIDWTVIFIVIIYGNLETMFTYLVFFFFLYFLTFAEDWFYYSDQNEQFLSIVWDIDETIEEDSYVLEYGIIII